MPTTRATSRNAATSKRTPHKAIVRSDTDDDPTTANGTQANDDCESDSDQESLVQAQLKAFMRNVRKLEENLRLLKKKNGELQQQLDAYKGGAPTTPRKRAPMNIETTIKMRDLESRVEELEKRNSRLNRKIKKLRQKELKAEADELNHGGSDDEMGDQDGFQRMKKLLRRFSRWMSITTLAEDPEDCPICLEQLKPKKSYAIPCEHLVCAECLPRVSRGADETIKCPQCRRDFPREEVGLLQYTETERWDELLKLASESTWIDYGGGDSSSEQEEENFIDDGESSSRMASSDRDEVEAQGEEDEDDQEAKTPRSTPSHSRSYADSPGKEKRKRMENLALLRSKKQRVF